MDSETLLPVVVEIKQPTRQIVQQGDAPSTMRATCVVSIRRPGMKIVDLTEDRKDLFCLCLEDWSDEAKEAGPKRREWLERSEKHGLGRSLPWMTTGLKGE